MRRERTVVSMASTCRLTRAAILTAYCTWVKSLKPGQRSRAAGTLVSCVPRSSEREFAESARLLCVSSRSGRDRPVREDHSTRIPGRVDARAAVRLAASLVGAAFRGLLHRSKQAARVLLNLRGRPRPLPLEEQVHALVVRDGDVCFDIGANVGWIALFLARTAAAARKVIAFEPAWTTYMRMCANIQKIINVKAPIFTMPLGWPSKRRRRSFASMRADSSLAHWPNRGPWDRCFRRPALLDTSVGSCPSMGFGVSMTDSWPTSGRSMSKAPSYSSCVEPRGTLRPVTGA